MRHTSVQFCNTSSVYYIVYLPPKVTSLSITMYLTPFTLFYVPPLPFPSGNHRTVLRFPECHNWNHTVYNLFILAFFFFFYLVICSFHSLIALFFFLALSSISFDVAQFTYLFTYWRTSCLLLGFSSYKGSCYKHPHADFCVDIAFNSFR